MLKGRIERLGIATSARIHPPTTDIFREYAASSFLAMSSHYEGFPMVLIEAMACGLPGVCFGFKCGPRDIIQDGVNGQIVPEGDVPALAKAMEGLMRDEALRTRMGEEARKVTQTYSEQNVMEQWQKCFDSLLR
jgi:glycosyltransferase involved in cell wall biosynthesis